VVRSLAAAAKWVDGVGLGAVYGKVDLVLPSLWEAVGGPDADWAVRDESGKATGFSPEFSKLWRWKDELPERKLVVAGRHLGRGAAALVAPRLAAPLYALTERAGKPEDFRDAELTALQREVAEVVLEHGPIAAPEVRRLLATGVTKQVNKAIEVLQRELVLTNAGVTDQEAGWPAIVQDVFARRWRAQLRRLPKSDDARRTLAATVLEHAGEVSAADVGAVFRWRVKATAAVLDELDADVRVEDGIKLFSARSARAGRTRRTRGTRSSGTR
jgi:hypothetical protein